MHLNVLHKLIQPFERVRVKTTLFITIGWILAILLVWVINSLGDKHLFPTPAQVWRGFVGLWNEGLIHHVGRSLSLCFQSMVVALIASITIAYLSPVPLLQPVSGLLSKFRFLPLVGLTYYMTVLVTEARDMQVMVLVTFMSTYFITSLMAMVRDVPIEEIDHARTLKCSRWEILWEVVVKGRLDNVLDILRQNLAIIWMMLVTVESILVASGGIGVLIKNSDKLFDQGRIVSLQIIILLVGLGLDLSINSFRKMMFRYAGK